MFPGFFCTFTFKSQHGFLKAKTQGGGRGDAPENALTLCHSGIYRLCQGQESCLSAQSRVGLNLEV